MAGLGGWKRSPVGSHHGIGQLLSPDVTRDDLLDEDVPAQDQIATDRAAHQTREELCSGVGLRPCPSVSDHEGREPIGVPAGYSKSDGTSPVLNHHGHVIEIELQRELLYHLGVLYRREPISRPRLREAEARVIQ